MGSGAVGCGKWAVGCGRWGSGLWAMGKWGSGWRGSGRLFCTSPCKNLTHDSCGNDLIDRPITAHLECDHDLATALHESTIAHTTADL